MLSGGLTAEAARKLTDAFRRNTGTRSGKKADMQGDLDPFNSSQGHFHAFVELHIEQGPLLERAHVPLGIVEVSGAPASYQLSVEAQAATPEAS